MFNEVDFTEAYGEVEISLHLFLNLALDGGKWLASFWATLHPRKEHRAYIELESGWGPEQIWGFGECEVFLTPAAIRKFQLKD